MNELEERMFRLSEALCGLEPENASRLRLALKFSREEQILDQMRETHKLLKDAQLSQGRDRNQGTDRQARTPAQPALGRRPRLPAQARPAPPDARNPQPARAHRQGRTSRARLVPLCHRARQTLGTFQYPPPRPGGDRPRSRGDPRRLPRTLPRARRNPPRTPVPRSGEREVKAPKCRQPA